MRPDPELKPEDQEVLNAARKAAGLPVKAEAEVQSEDKIEAAARKAAGLSPRE